MGNKNRYRNGKRQLVEVPVASASVIEKGDFVCLSGGNAVTPSELLAQGSEKTSKALARDAVADTLIGIAENASAAGDTDDILVDVSLDSIYELDQATAAAISFGDKIGVYASSTASASYTASDDTVEADATNPIAVCVKAHSSAQGVGTLAKLLPNTTMNSTGGQD